MRIGYVVSEAPAGLFLNKLIIVITAKPCLFLSWACWCKLNKTQRRGKENNVLAPTLFISNLKLNLQEALTRTIVNPLNPRFGKEQ